MIKQIAARFLQIDGTLRYAYSARLWQALSALVTLTLILRFTQPLEQGLFYTFNSVLNLQIFFELGLSFVVLQCTPHYFQSLTWGEQGQILGSEDCRHTFLTFAQKGVRLYGVIAASFLVLMLPIGWIFFGARQAEYAVSFWVLPWILLVLGTVVNLCLSPVLALLEGSGKIEKIYRLRWRFLLWSNLAAWIIFSLTHALYLPVVNVWLTATITGVWLYKTHPIFLKALWRTRFDHSQFSWFKEIWPMQWRIAITWMSGYFINQIFTPLVFYYQGTIASGQMGVCLTVMNMLSLFAITRVTVRSPNMGDLAARNERVALNQMFATAFWQSVVIFLLGAFGIGLLLYLFHTHAIMAKFLAWQDIILLLMGYLFVHIIGALSLYLRAHKVELFTPLSVIGAVSLALSAWYGAIHYGSLGVCWSIFLVNAGYGFPSALWLWVKFKRTRDNYEQESDISEAYR
ncbi:MAG: hypothetical protein NXI01_04060 [Gammaproteobacteria bacterium]|nr:hypothetical protein [Gammaproteobacteria bacterium]